MEDILRAFVFIALFAGIFLGAMVVENLIARSRGRVGLYRFPETLTNITTGASYKIADGLAIALFIQLFYDWMYERGLQWDPELSVVSIIALILFIDLYMYAAHYAMHKFRWFWNAHVTHHSSDHMNLSTALRQNFTYALSGTWILWWIPAAFVGFDKTWTLIAIEANLVYQFFLHTEQVKSLGWAEKIFNTPSHHRVHHGSNPKQIDKNFGGIFIIWDKLFGTFQAEETAGEIVYGVKRMPEKPNNPWHAQVYDWQNMFRDLKTYKDPRILWKHPDWVTEMYGNDNNAYEDGETSKQES